MQLHESSTVLREMGEARGPLLPEHMKDPQRKRVRFSATNSVQLIENRADLDIETVHNMHWSRFELKNFKKHAEYVSMCAFDDEILVSSSGLPTYSLAMWEAYQSCTRTIVVPRHQVPTRKVANLEHWVDQHTTRRGLERWIVPAFHDEMSIRQQKAVQSVLKMQSKCEGVVSLRDKFDVIAKIYEQYSKPSKLFAKLMGDADAAACQSDAEENYNKRKQLDIFATEESLKKSRSDSGLYVRSQCRAPTLGGTTTTRREGRQRYVHFLLQ